MFQTSSNTSTALRVQNGEGVSIFGAEIHPTVSPKQPCLFCYFHMYRTLAHAELFGRAADGGAVLHDKFAQPGGPVVNYAAFHVSTPRFINVFHFMLQRAGVVRKSPGSFLAWARC